MEAPHGSLSFGTAEGESALIAAAQRGDLSAFEKIVNLYRKRIYAVVYRMTSRHDVAEDLGQEAFVRFWKNLARFEPTMPIFPFLRKIAVNLTINFFASRSRQAQSAEPELLEVGQQLSRRGDEDPVENLALTETRAALAAAIAELAPERKMVLTLRVVEGMSYEAIAETMDCSIGTVMSRLFRARSEIKERLEKKLGKEALAEWQRDASGAAEGAPVPL